MAEIIEIVLKVILALLALFGGKEIVDRIVVKFNKKETHHTVSVASGEAVGRDKVVINNYNFPGMGNPEDLFLSPDKSDSVIINDPYNDGLAQIDFEDEALQALGEFFDGFYQKTGKGGPRNAATMFRGAAYAVGTKPHNPEWQQHCATSLREIFMPWKGQSQLTSDIKKICKSDKNLSKKELDAIAEFWLLYRYFTGIDHYEPQAIIGPMKQKYDNQLMKYEDCVTEKVFIEQVKSFFALVAEITTFRP